MSDFSSPPGAELRRNLDEGYTGLHFEQGVPILDRDLNLLQDLITATVRSVLTQHIGSGTAADDSVFAVRGGTVDNDVAIDAGAGAQPGRCLVDGVEVTIEAATTYLTQPRDPGETVVPLSPPASGGDRIDTVYLDVFMTTVDADTDPVLRNDADVGMQTTVRVRPAWRVRVEQGSPHPPEPVPDGHAYMPLAHLTRRRGVPRITDEMIDDLRRTRLSLSDAVERMARLEALVVQPAFATVDPFDPPQSPVNGTVVLSGRNFDLPNLAVFFGAVPAPIVPNTITPTRVSVSVPPGAPSPCRITVRTDGGTATAPGLFTPDEGDPRPTFAADVPFRPVIGAPGTPVTLFGTNFNQPDLRVEFGGTPAPTATSDQFGTAIATQVPAGVEGELKIKVRTGSGEVETTTRFRAGPAPAFRATEPFDPTFAFVGGEVTLFGTGFAHVEAVTFGGRSADIEQKAATRLVVVVPEGVSGTVPIVVTSDFGHSTASGFLVESDI